MKYLQYKIPKISPNTNKCTYNGHKIHDLYIKKSVAFLYTSNEQSKKKLRKPHLQQYQKKNKIIKNKFKQEGERH